MRRYAREFAIPPPTAQGDPSRIVNCPPMPCGECGPSSVASRWTVCPRCQKIIAKCSVHGANMDRVRADHRC